MHVLLRAAAHTLLCLFSALSASAESDASLPSEVQTKAPIKVTAAAPVLRPEDEKWIRSTPLRTKVGQLFIFGFMGLDTERGLQETLARLKPGALVVFGRNIKTAQQIISLNRTAQRKAIAASGLPLLIAVDQEGGSVIRIKTSPPLPSALALGESPDSDLVFKAGLHTGHLLKVLGFNMNLAPVLDVADPNRDAFVGTRTFGNDPENVGVMGTRFAEGLNTAGVIPTAKHFPGHGGVTDSHLQTPVKNTTPEMLAKIDLVPFTSSLSLIPDSAVMLAHVAYPKLDPTNTPASFSRPIVQDLLRDKMGFGGLVITDDIEMGGAAVIKNPGERAIRAIEAGADLVMIAWNKRLQSAAVEAVVRAVKSGRLSEARVDESLRRIIHAKRTVVSDDPQKEPSHDQLQAVLRSEELRKLTFETLYRSFQTSIDKLPNKEMVHDQSRPIFVFAAAERFFSSFKQKIKDRLTRFYRLSSEGSFNINRVLRANPEAVGVLYVSGRQSARFANLLDPDTAARVIIINSETVSLLKAPENFHHIVGVYFQHPDLGRITAQYFFMPPKLRNDLATDAAPAATRSPAAATSDDADSSRRDDGLAPPSK